ncbi:hypothetical protein RKD19_000068 [Streptomyces canus]
MAPASEPVAARTVWGAKMNTTDCVSPAELPEPVSAPLETADPPTPRRHRGVAWIVPNTPPSGPGRTAFYSSYGS